MGTLEILLLAVALAMDCFAVSTTSGIMLKSFRWRVMLATALSFGIFQAAMPLIGWFCVIHFSGLLDGVDHWIAFGLLAYLGVKMIMDAFKPEEAHSIDPKKPTTILVMAVATSIDALAVGISFACLEYKTAAELMFPVTIIGLVSLAMSLAGLSLGIVCGKRLERRVRPELVGGIILILIGTKVLFEHLGII